MTVLVCGGTGTTGSQVVARLQALGQPSRALTRRADAVDALRRRGIDAVVGDLADPTSLAQALDGVRVVYVATNASRELPRLEAGLARAAALASVCHVVKLSVIGAAADAPFTFARLHAEAEDAVRSSGVRWTFVRPNGFMQNTLGWAGQLRSGVLHAPVPDARWSIVDARDAADVAVAALMNPEAHAGKVWTVTGPQALSAREEAAVLTELLGRKIRLEEVTVPSAVYAMVGAGWPAWSAQRMGELFDFYATGAAEVVSGDVHTVTGRSPRTYATFAAHHLQAFR